MPLIKVNCAAIPETLLESELFGHVRGAFTGAVANKKGRFALADGGTIFLDEIGTIEPAAAGQAAARAAGARVRAARRRSAPQKVDVRVIAATNRDLRQLVAEGRFREDLFYRLNVIPIEIPPLRERREDIPLLVEHFVAQARAAHRQAHRPASTTDVLAALQRLRLAGQRARAREHHRARGRALTGPPSIRARTSSHARRAPARRAPALPSLEPAPEHRVGRARDRPARARERGGVKKDAAELMGISQRALSYYLAKYRID